MTTLMREDEYMKKSRWYRFWYSLSDEDTHYGRACRTHVEPSGWFISLIMFAIVVALFLLVSSFVACGNACVAPNKQAWVETIQNNMNDMDVCDTQSRKDAMWSNQAVLKYQKYNQNWFFDWYIPDTWNDMHTVKLEGLGKCYQNTSLKVNDYNISGVPAEINVNLKQDVAQ